MAVITIGSAAIDRAASTAIVWTRVGKGGSADGTGEIDTVEIYLLASGTAVEVATFIDKGSNVLSTRDTEAIGAVNGGSKQTFSGLTMDVVTGDYLGIYGTTGSIQLDTSGDGYWYQTGDYIPCTDVTFTFSASRTISLYGTGEEVAAGWSHKFLGVANAAIGKINGVAIADIGKVNGVA